MTILEFHSENVKKLKVVNFKPRQVGLVIVAGENGAGKSSVLDNIAIALGGEDQIPDKVVRKGKAKAVSELNLGEYVVRRTITADGGGSLVVRNADGVKMPSPQALLDKLYGRLSFDPLDFARQNADKRSETLRQLLGLNFKELDAEYKMAYDARTLVNRTLKAKEALVQGNPRHMDVPKEEQSASAITEEMNKAAAQNKANQEKRNAVEVALREAQSVATMAKANATVILNIEAEIKRQQGKLVEATESLKKLEQDLEARNKHAALLDEEAKDLKDIALTDFTRRMSEVEQINQKVRKNQQIDAIVVEFKEATKQSEKLSDQLKGIEERKAEMLAEAKFPVPGLGLSDTNDVLFEGIPFDNASTAQKLKVSVAMGLAMNPKLKVLLVRQGNDLDDNNLKLVAEMAEAAGAQIWLEKISTSGDVSVIIEDGHIKGEADLSEKEPEKEPKEDATPASAKAQKEESFL